MTWKAGCHSQDVVASIHDNGVIVISNYQSAPTSPAIKFVSVCHQPFGLQRRSFLQTILVGKRKGSSPSHVEMLNFPKSVITDSAPFLGQLFSAVRMMRLDTKTSPMAPESGPASVTLTLQLRHLATVKVSCCANLWVWVKPLSRQKCWCLYQYNYIYISNKTHLTSKRRQDMPNIYNKIIQNIPTSHLRSQCFSDQSPARPTPAAWAFVSHSSVHQLTQRHGKCVATPT